MPSPSSTQHDGERKNNSAATSQDSLPRPQKTQLDPFEDDSPKPFWQFAEFAGLENEEGEEDVPSHPNVNPISMPPPAEDPANPAKKAATPVRIWTHTKCYAK